MVVPTDIEKDLDLQKLKKELSKKFDQYQKTMRFMAADAPIAILCLPKQIEESLVSHGCFRVYDIFDLDFTKIKGLNDSRIRDITSRLDQFLSML